MEKMEEVVKATHTWPGQVLGVVLEETGLGVEDELVWCKC